MSKISITNNSESQYDIAGVSIPANGAAEFEATDWTKAKKGKVVTHLLTEKILVEGKAKAEKAEKPEAAAHSTDRPVATAQTGVKG